jgi:hypothetical protein
MGGQGRGASALESAVKLMIGLELQWDTAVSDPGSPDAVARAQALLEIAQQVLDRIERLPRVAKVAGRSAWVPQMPPWRARALVYRAAYDLLQILRWQEEQAREAEAIAVLAQCSSLGFRDAAKKAVEILFAADHSSTQASLKALIETQARALFAEIGMQLSVAAPWLAAGIGRGASLDTLGVPLNGRLWLRAVLDEIAVAAAAAAAAAAPAERRRASGSSGSPSSGDDPCAAVHREIVAWRDPGPGGFYDNLGRVGAESHLVRGAGAARDPGFYSTILDAFQGKFNVSTVPVLRFAWYSRAVAFYDTPLRLRYPDLPAGSEFSITIVYANNDEAAPVQMTANGLEVHGPLAKPSPMRPLTFPIPPAATSAGGTLEIVVSTVRGLGGDGRSVQASEVWLKRLGES